ncbi:MAG: hypothetical protein IT496_01440 [Gammaproteobacteria bacterium]|nr:hypothetical protein [Gammaproteobacteria bacterium]
MFKTLGIAVGLYAAYAAATGSVYANSGAWGRSITRAASPRRFWTVIAIYAGVSIALLTIF